MLILIEKFTKRMEHYNIEKPVRTDLFGNDIVYNREELIRVLQGSTSEEVRIISSEDSYSQEGKVHLKEEYEQYIGRVVDFAGECIILMGVPFEKEKEKSGDSSDEKEVF